jgi:hypothetical protein
MIGRRAAAGARIPRPQPRPILRRNSVGARSFARLTEEEPPMCRSIKTLRGTDGPASDEEVRAASLQFVRKVSGYRAPSRRNAEAFDAAVDEVSAVTRRLLASLGTR